MAQESADSQPNQRRTFFHKPILEGNSPQKYRDCVKRWQKWQPGLQGLDDFMGKSANISGKETFDIDVVHILSSGEAGSVNPCSSKEDFDREIKNAPSDRIGTLLFVENLSWQTIEAVGIELQLMPEFFASYIEGTEWYNKGKWIPPAKIRTTRLSSSYRTKVPFYELGFSRSYPFNHSEVVEKRGSVTRTPRAIYTEKYGKSAAQEKISVYKTKIDETHYGKLKFFLAYYMPCSRDIKLTT
jgi:hypothetical protein